TRCEPRTARAPSRPSFNRALWRLEYLGAKTGGLAHGLGDTRKDFQRQVTALGRCGRASGRVDLDQRNDSAAVLEFEQATGILLDFLQRGFFTLKSGKQTLNHRRPQTALQQDIGQNLLERNIGAVYLVKIGVRAAIEFDPDLIAAREV